MATIGNGGCTSQQYDNNFLNISSTIDADGEPLKKPHVIVAVPAYNEETSIGSVVLRSRKYAHKVIVIDDGSHDKTSEIACMAGAEVISHKVNQGKGAGIRNAFEYARKARADILVLIDGDGQHNPDDIPCLLAPILKKEADFVNGSRFIGGNGHNVPIYRRVGQEILSAATNVGSKLKVSDTQNGFRAFSRDTFSCFSFNENGMAIESEMLMDAARSGLRIKEVPIIVRYDVDGSTYNPVAHGLDVLGKIIRLTSQRRPMLFFCVPGILSILAGISVLVYVFAAYGSANNLAIGFIIIAILATLAGFSSLFTGVILNTILS